MALSILLGIASFINAGMLVFAFSRKEKTGASYFAALSAALFFYCFGYFLELSASTSGEAFIAICMEYLGIPMVASFFLLTSLGFFAPKALRPWMFPTALALGLCFFFLVYTNDQHHLYYTALHMVYNGAFYLAVSSRGPLYMVMQGFVMAQMAIAYVFLFLRFSKGNRKLRSQMTPFLLGSLIPLVANLSNLLNLSPMNIDLAPLAMTCGMLFFAFTLYQHKLMDIVPAVFDMAVEKMEDGLVVMDCDWCFIYCNQQAKLLFPVLDTFLGTEDVLSAPGWPAVLGPDSDPKITFSLTDSVTGEKTLLRATRSSICTKRKMPLGFSIVFRDITETDSMLNRLEELAISDPLTGVFNRRHFLTLVERQMAMARRLNLPISLLLMDIDHFKRVNDTYSHLAGDKVLCSVVQTMSQQMRSHDVIARYGGEEFVIMSAESEEAGLLAFANRLRKNIENEAIEFEGNPIHITASFGVVLIYPGDSYEEAMEAADAALYKAKNGGRNQTVLGEIKKKPG